MAEGAVMRCIRSHLTYANVMVTLVAFIVLGGVSYAATGGNFILGQSNTASSRSTLSAPIHDRALQVTNTSTGAGATALGLNVANGHAPFTVNSDTKVSNLNADQLDGQSSTAFGQVRQFRHSVDAASAGPPVFDMVTFRGLTLSSWGVIDPGPVIECQLLASAPGSGQIDSFWVPDYGGVNPRNTPTPVNQFYLAEAFGSDAVSVGQLVFRNAATGRVLTVAYSIDTPQYTDINDAACHWQGTITAAG